MAYSRILKRPYREDYEAAIAASAPYKQRAKYLTEQTELANKNLGLQEQGLGLQREAMEFSKATEAERLRLAEAELAQNKKNATTSSIISGVGTATNLGLAGKQLLSKKTPKVAPVAGKTAVSAGTMNTGVGPTIASAPNPGAAGIITGVESSSPALYGDGAPYSYSAPSSTSTIGPTVASEGLIASGSQAAPTVSATPALEIIGESFDAAAPNLGYGGASTAPAATSTAPVATAPATTSTTVSGGSAPAAGSGMTWVEGIGWVGVAAQAANKLDTLTSHSSDVYKGGSGERTATLGMAGAGGVVGGYFGGPAGAAIGMEAGAATGHWTDKHLIDRGYEKIDDRLEDSFDSPEDFVKSGIELSKPALLFDPLSYAIENWIEDELCVIVTACDGRDSYEVDVARSYRDEFMDRQSLGGYYAIAAVLVPRIEKSGRIKNLVKKFLVDRLIDYGEVALGIKPRRDFKSSLLVSKFFLALCRVAGFFVGEKVTKMLCVAHGNGR